MSRKNLDVSCWMRTEPFSENEIALFVRLQSMDNKKLGAKLPAWAKPIMPPKQFVFKAGAAPVFPAHVKPNTISKPVHKAYLCADGPYAGEKLEICIEGAHYHEHATLVFSTKGVKGFYTLRNARLHWVTVV